MLLKLFSFNSLQGRHLIATFTITLAILVGVFTVFFSVQEIRKDAAINLENRGQLLANSRQIHDSLWQGYTYLDRFLLDPNQNEYAEKALASFTKAQKYTGSLLEHPWLVKKSQNTNLSQLPSIFDNLQSAINHLVESRKDPTRQYPAMAISNENLRPNLRAFVNAMAIFTAEAMSEEQKPYFDEVYPELTQTRYLWTQMVSNFRIYMANQLGVFDKSALTTQEQSIELLYGGVKEQLSKLSNFDNQGKLGFESSDALEELYATSKSWFGSFIDIRKSYKDKNWRTDVNLMQTTIEPRLTEIWDLLLSFELLLEQSVATDIEELNTSAKHQENLLWGISTIIIVVAILSFLSMRRLVFRPISLVTRALHEEAAGETGIIIPSSLTMETQNLVEAFSKMRAKIHNRQIALEKKSLYDELTGLPNRSLFIDRIKQSLSQTHNSQTKIALIAIEIRHLKKINDTLGHNVGDRVLVEISQRLQSISNPHDTISRTGGDQFAVLLNNSLESDALIFSEKITEVLSKKHHIQQLNIEISPILGIATYPSHANNYTQLYQRADIAKHMAKKTMIQVMMYAAENDEYNNERLNLMADLKDALNQDNLELHYQPKLNLKNSQVAGVEALLRWNHPKFGWIDAEETVLIAEQSGFIDQLSFWTIKTGIKQCADWQKIGIKLSMAINLSVHTLQNENFTNFIKNTLTEFDLPPSYLVLEITESAMMTNPLKASRVALKLDQIGIVLSADDFGTGFSSFSYLKHIPIDEIKIDKSFIINMINDGTDIAIVKSAINLARSLGLSVIAEGVETEETRLMLQKLDCDYGQGYYFSKPLTAKAFIKWLNSKSSLETTD